MKSAAPEANLDAATKAQPGIYLTWTNVPPRPPCKRSEIGDLDAKTPKRWGAAFNLIETYRSNENPQQREGIQMASARKVSVLVGSIRKDSINRKVAKALAEVAGPSLELDIVEIKQLPLYDPDADAKPPAEWTAFRDRVKASEAVLFVTPEHNRSVPAALKNALDIGSRPYGQSIWNGKPGAIVSASPGGIGGFGANHHLRQSLVFLNVPAMQQPEAYIGGADKLFDASGNLVNEGTRKFLRDFMQAFATWIAANSKQ
jgi:chromate reductase